MSHETSLKRHYYPESIRPEGLEPLKGTHEELLNTHNCVTAEISRHTNFTRFILVSEYPNFLHIFKKYCVSIVKNQLKKESNFARFMLLVYRVGALEFTLADHFSKYFELIWLPSSEKDLSFIGIQFHFDKMSELTETSKFIFLIDTDELKSRIINTYVETFFNFPDSKELDKLSSRDVTKAKNLNKNLTSTRLGGRVFGHLEVMATPPNYYQKVSPLNERQILESQHAIILYLKKQLKKSGFLEPQQKLFNDYTNELEFLFTEMLSPNQKLFLLPSSLNTNEFKTVCHILCNDNFLEMAMNDLSDSYQIANSVFWRKVLILNLSFKEDLQSYNLRMLRKLLQSEPLSISYFPGSDLLKNKNCFLNINRAFHGHIIIFSDKNSNIDRLNDILTNNGINQFNQILPLDATMKEIESAFYNFTHK